MAASRPQRSPHPNPLYERHVLPQMGGIKEGAEWMSADLYGAASPRDTVMPHHFTTADLMRGGAGAHAGIAGIHHQYGLDAGRAGGMAAVHSHNSLRLPQSSAEAIQLGNSSQTPKVRGLTRDCRSSKQAEQTRKAQTAKKMKSKPNTVVIHDILARWMDETFQDESGVVRKRITIVRSELTPQGRPKELTFLIDNAEKFAEEVRMRLAENQSLGHIEQYTLTTNLIRARCTPGWYKHDGSDNYRSSLSPNDWKSPEWKLSPRNWSKSTHENFEDKLEPFFFPFKRKQGDGINWIQHVHNLEREACLAGQQSIYVIGAPTEQDDGPPLAKRSRGALESPGPASAAGVYSGCIGGLLDEPQQPMTSSGSQAAAMGTAPRGTGKVVHGHAQDRAVSAEAQAVAKNKKKCCWDCKNEKKSRKECRAELFHTGPDFDKDTRYRDSDPTDSPSSDNKKGPTPRRNKTGSAHEANVGISLLAHAATSLLSIPTADGGQELVSMMSVPPPPGTHSNALARTPRMHDASSDLHHLGPSISENEEGSRSISVDLDGKGWSQGDEIGSNTGTGFATAASSFSRPCVSRAAVASTPKAEEPPSLDKTPSGIGMSRPLMGEFNVDDSDMLSETQEIGQGLVFALNEAERAGALDSQEARTMDNLTSMLSQPLLSSAELVEELTPYVRRMRKLRDDVRAELEVAKKGSRSGKRRYDGQARADEEYTEEFLDASGRSITQRLDHVQRIVDEMSKIPGMPTLTMSP